MRTRVASSKNVPKAPVGYLKKFAPRDFGYDARCGNAESEDFRFVRCRLGGYNLRLYALSFTTGMNARCLGV